MLSSRAKTGACVVALTLCATSGLFNAASGAERFSRPEFRETGYEYPRNQHPSPPRAWHEAVDAALLIAALLIAAALSLRLRSRPGIVALAFFCLAWFGFWRQGCVCPVGSVQNVVSSLAHSEFILPVGVLAFFMAPLVCALFFGRVFCSAVCPLGAVQELALVRPLAVPLWLDRPLRALPWLLLCVASLSTAIGAGFTICRLDPFVHFFRLAGSGEALLTAVAALMVSAVIGRPYCRYLCPYGALLGLLSRAARWRTAIAPDGCIRCRLCEHACPYAAILPPEPATFRDAAEHSRERRILACCLAAVPLLFAAGAAVGYAGRHALASGHPAVQLKAALARSAEKRSAAQQERCDAFYQSNGDPEALAAAVEKIYRRAAIGSAFAGGIFGLIIAVGLISITVRRKRVDYEAHSAWCFACGRCYAVCPRSRAWALRSQPAKPPAAGAAGQSTAPHK